MIGGRSRAGVAGRVALSAAARMAFTMAACILMLAAPSVRAQEATLDQFFEGKQVVVLIDMPGSQQGVDLYPDRPNSLDANNYGKRMKSFPVSLRVGDSAMITKVKVSGKRIEFQLAGGGFGTAGDATDTSVHFTPAEKSQREKDLQDQINNTDDSDQKRKHISGHSISHFTIPMKPRAIIASGAEDEPTDRNSGGAWKRHKLQGLAPGSCLADAAQ